MENNDTLAQIYLDRLKSLFEDHASAQNAVAMAKYMRGQFPFYGIKSPLHKSLTKQVWQELGAIAPDVFPAFCKLCFQASEKREVQYIVNNYGRRLARQLPLDFITTIEELIPQCSWWDTIDFLAPKIAGKILLPHPKDLQKVATNWILHDNFWFQRSAILLQLDYKEETNSDLLFGLIQRRIKSKEFFVQKAAGWALRQYSRINPEKIQWFIDRHPNLPKLTKREGEKYLRKINHGDA